MFELELDITNITCHSGGAEGSDTYWETIGEEFGVSTKAWSYKTKYHKSKNKVEMSIEDNLEGIDEIKKANKFLKRTGINKYMNILSRNWAQVKYSNEIFAIGYLDIKNNIVNGGTGYAVQMGINNHRIVYVYDQNCNHWFRWSYPSLSFIKLRESPKISCQNFAGIGTRQITDDGIRSIREVYENTFG